MIPAEVYSEIVNSIEEYNPGFDQITLKEAFDFANIAHDGQKRASGEPYFLYHPCQVALIAARELRLDLTSIQVALLHDVAEDTKYTIEDIQEKFGEVVAENVVGVTKLSKRFFRSASARTASNFRKMIIAMAKDIRVILVKLCDRLHNMRTLQFLNEEKQKRIASDTMEVYAPLAHRLGVNKLCYELEDLSLRYLDPEFYLDLKSKIAKKKRARDSEIKSLESEIAEVIREYVPEVEIQGRPKHFYSIYCKIKEGKKTLDSLYDLVGIRIITSTLDECYTILGLLHKNWRPVPGRFKDYIAVPKSNNYQSLHTTLIHKSGEPFEAQIRTLDMHEVAEKGVAAHWSYKTGDGKGNIDIKKTFAWLQQLIEWYQDVHNAGEFMNTVKLELFSKLVFCFTPGGDIFELPLGATPLDFAFHIHTEVGRRCVGAKVNGSIVPLNYELKNGDIVKILTSKSTRKPPSGWLKIARTTLALKKIRHALKKEMRDEYIAKGTDTLVETLKKWGASSEDCGLVRANRFNGLAKKLGFSGATELYLGVGNGELNPVSLLAKLFPEVEFKESNEKKQKKKKVSDKERKRSRKSPSCILVNGEKDYLVRMSKCCNPIPGDPIIGFITKGRGVSIHREGCNHLGYHLKNDDGREIAVSWNISNLETVVSNRQNSLFFQFDFVVETKDRPGTLNNLTKIISEEGINIVAMRADSRGSRGYFFFKVEVKNLNTSKSLMKLLAKNRDVIRVSRKVI